MRILFLVQDFIIEPLGIMYLSSSLRQRGHEVMVFKVNFPGYGFNALSSERIHDREVVRDIDLITRIKKFSPHLIGYSTTTGMHRYYIELNRNLKNEIGFLSVFGGPHPTFFPEIIEEEGVDIICRGEGEEAIVELADKLEMGDDYTTVRNMWVKIGRSITRNKLRPLKKDLDNIPFPDRELFYRLFPSLRANPIKNFMASRGCPYDCSYCFNHIYRKLYSQNGIKIRYRSPNCVIKEIKSVMDNYPLEIVYFQDDTFNLNMAWLEAFLEVYRREIGLPFHAHLRPDLIDKKLIEMLVYGNCLSVTLAFETADDTIRRGLLKREMSREEMLSAARLLRRYNIKFRIENMVGLPTGNIDIDWQTLELNIKARPSIGWASLYQPYPRTALGEFCKKEKLVDSLELDCIQPSFFQSTILKLRCKSRVENLQKLFSITVEWPFLKPVIKHLIKLPPNRFFNWVYVQWKRYAYNRRLYKVPSYRKISFSPKCLFIALGGVGNVIMAIPFIRELKEKFPRSRLTVVVLKGRGGKELLEMEKTVDEIFVYDPSIFKGKLLSWIMRKRFDVALTMYPVGRNIFDMMAFFVRIPWRIKHVSIKKDRVDDFLHNVLISVPPDYHHQDYNRQLVYAMDKIFKSHLRKKRRVFDIYLPSEKFPTLLDLEERDTIFLESFYRQVGIEKEDLVLGIHPGSRPETSQKRWPGERFVSLAEKIYQRYRAKLLIFGSPEEDDELNRIIGSVRCPVIKVNNLNIREVAILIKSCRLFIANDSGLMHLSQAVGTSLIAIFGPSNPSKVGPVNHNSLVLRTTHPLSCAGIKLEEMCCPFLHRNNCPYKVGDIVECMFYLTVDEVMAAVEKMLEYSK